MIKRAVINGRNANASIQLKIITLEDPWIGVLLLILVERLRPLPCRRALSFSILA